MIGMKMIDQPVQLNIPKGFALQISTGPDLVQVPVDIKFQHRSGMISGATFRIFPLGLKAERPNIKVLNKSVDEPNGVIL